jgi:hypothetical protein
MNAHSASAAQKEIIIPPDIIRTIHSAGTRTHISSHPGLIKRKGHGQDFLALFLRKE